MRDGPVRRDVVVAALVTPRQLTDRRALAATQARRRCFFRAATGWTPRADAVATPGLPVGNPRTSPQAASDDSTGWTAGCTIGVSRCPPSHPLRGRRLMPAPSQGTSASLLE